MFYSKHCSLIVYSVRIDACSYIVSDPYCLLYYGTFFFLLGMSVVGLLEKKKKKFHPLCRLLLY